MQTCVPFTIALVGKDGGKPVDVNGKAHTLSTVITATGALKGETRQIEEAWETIQNRLRYMHDQELVEKWEIVYKNGIVEKLEVLTMMNNKFTNIYILHSLLRYVENSFTIPLDVADNRLRSPRSSSGGKAVPVSQPFGKNHASFAGVDLSAQKRPRVYSVRESGDGEAGKEIYAHIEIGGAEVVGKSVKPRSSSEELAAVIASGKNVPYWKKAALHEYIRVCLLIRKVPLFAEVEVYVKGEQYRTAYQRSKVFRYVKYKDARLHVVHALNSRFPKFLKRHKTTANRVATTVMNDALTNQDSAFMLLWLLYVNPDEGEGEWTQWKHWTFTNSKLREIVLRGRPSKAWSMIPAQTEYPMDEVLHACITHRNGT